MILSVAFRIEIIHVNLIVLVWNHRFFPANTGMSYNSEPKKALDSPWRKDFSQSIRNLRIEVRREDDVKLQDHPPLLKWVSVLGHPLALNLLKVTSLDDFSCDNIGSVINISIEK